MIQEPEAITVLRETGDLSNAIAVSRGGKDLILGALREARGNLYVANGRAFEYKGDTEVMNSAESVLELARRIVNELTPDKVGTS